MNLLPEREHITACIQEHLSCHSIKLAVKNVLPRLAVIIK